MSRFQKVLVANRGEIARRVMRSCKRLGISTVAVFSDADANAAHVRQADQAVHIGPAASAESYLVIEKIIEAAKRTGADAIHPGYGFLAENADFAKACADAGVKFIGPSPESILAMGKKREAKALAAKADVPVIPGYDGADQDPSVLKREAERVGFPLLLKASAGGGGKGMRRVTQASELDDAIAGAKREGENSFGDGTLLIERYIEQPRHVEIQILGDEQGNLVHLFERECSIQRRHQKVIEESPSPALDETLRKRMGEAAVRVGKAIGYANAGTVEFIMDPDGNFYFLEVNTRLQVEHPVTECVTGLDLVELQLRVAQGEPLPFTQDELSIHGWAIEARLYAEDPASGFLPASGPVVKWAEPNLEGVRFDGAVESGDEVSIHYDPMIAKVIAEGPSREVAIQRLDAALSQLAVHGLTTNRAFLLTVLRHEAFVAGNLHTHFIDEHLSEALAAKPDTSWTCKAAMAAVLAQSEERLFDRGVLPRVRPGFRLNTFQDQHTTLEMGEMRLRVQYRDLRGAAAGARKIHVTVWDGETPMANGAIPATSEPLFTADVVVHDYDGERLLLELDGLREAVAVHLHGVSSDRAFVQWGERSFDFRESDRFPLPGSQLAPGSCVAPMPGKVIDVRVGEGDSVSEGQVLLVMEAMKMEHALKAPQAGVVRQVSVTVGQQVDADALLVVVEEA